MQQLNVIRRSMTDKATNLRNLGFIPGVVYGPKLENMSVALSKVEIRNALKEDGEVYEINTKNGQFLVKFNEIQKDPVSGEIIHFSLQQMNRGETTNVDIPIELSGMPQGVKAGGTLVILKDFIEVEGVPSEIPMIIKGNVSHLKLGDSLTVNELDLPKSITTTSDMKDVVAVCQPPAILEERATETVVEGDSLPEKVELKEA